jgi:hypothetical protein
MGIERGKTIEAPDQESGAMMPEIAPVLRRENEELGIDDASKPSSWRKRLGTLMLAGTVLAGSIVGNAKEAEAGPHFSREIEQMASTAGQRTAEGLGRGAGNLMEKIFGGGKTAREQEEEARLKQDIIRKQFNDAQQLNKDAVKRGWQKQDNLENTQTQLDKELIQQYRQELKDAKTPEQVKFVNEKYKSIIQLPGSSNSSGQWRR